MRDEAFTNSEFEGVQGDIALPAIISQIFGGFPLKFMVMINVDM